MTIGSLDIFPRGGGNSTNTNINSLTGYPLTVPHGGTGKTSLANGVLIGEGTNPINSIPLSNGQVLIGSTGTDPVANTLTAGPNITITNGAGSVTISSISGGSGGVGTWVDVTTTAMTMSPNTGYVADNAALVTLTFPGSMSFGQVIRVVGFNSGGWKIQLNGGQVIHLGNQNTSSGGSLASTNQYDTVELLCTKNNTDFVALSFDGNLTLA